MKIDKNLLIKIKTRTGFARAEQSPLSGYACTEWAYELSAEDQDKDGLAS